MVNRCIAIITDNKTHRNRRCMKSFKFDINGCKYCHIHANKNFAVYISKIQAAYRSYLCRNKVKKIKEMPTDIQQIITGFVREDFINARYNCQLSNFIIKKIRNYLYNLCNTNIYYSCRIIDRQLNNVKNLYDLAKLNVLINKYESILNYNNNFTTPMYCYDYYYNYNKYSLKELMKKILNIGTCKIDDLQNGKLIIYNGLLVDLLEDLD
jgi:hypothetical protein